MGALFCGQILLLLALFLESIGASHVFNAYRAIQFDRAESQRGCRKTYLNANAAVLSEGGVPQKQALVLRIEELTSAVLQKLGSSAGILLLLPESFHHSAKISNTTMNVLRDLETMLLSSTVEVPIYFAVEDSRLTSIYTSLKQRVHDQLSPLADTYSVVVSEKEAEKVKQFQVVSMHGLLQAGEPDLPTFALVTHYDTLGIAPGFSKGTDFNGSGTLAVLELARLFSKLYSNAKTRGSHNLIFILGNGGHLNYLGIRQWLQKSPTILGNIEFALCLEGIGAEQLFLHVSRKPKDDNVNLKHLYELFASTAARQGIPFEVIQKKINVSHPEMAWAHEAFAYKKVPAATLSSASSPSPLLTRSSPVEQRANPANLERNIGFIADVMVQYLYPTPLANATVLRGSIAVNSKFLGSWGNYFSTFARPDPYLSEDPKAKIPAGLATNLPTLLSKTLQSYVGDVRVDKEVETGKGGLIFYTNIVNTMNVYNTKPVLFDILLFVPIAAYLAAINIYLRGLSQIKELLGAATRSAPVPKRK